MRKHQWFFTLLIIFIAFAMIFAGCTDSQVQGEQPSPSETDPVNEPDEPQEIPPTVQTEKYYIDLKNYLIRPVDPDGDAKVVLLTFDDAPEGTHTRDILDTLDKYNAKSIFFVTGYYAVRDEELIKEIYDRGHLIGNHTWNHHNFNEMKTHEETEREIVRLNELIKKITGEDMKYIRPPFGAHSKNPYLNDILKELNIQKMTWSLGSLDWEFIYPERHEDVVNQVLNNTHNGANILMHDKEITALALDKILAGLEEKGFSFVLPTEIIFE